MFTKHFKPAQKIKFAIFTASLCSLIAAADASDITPAQTKQLTKNTASQKITESLLSSLVEKPDLGVIVEFEAAKTQSTMGKNQDSNTLINKMNYQDAKASLRKAMLINDYKVEKEYDALPMQYIRLKDRRALVQLLNHPKIKHIYENTMNYTVGTTTPNLSLINQPQTLNMGARGSGTAVVVIDTGVDYSRPAFGSCTAPGIPAGCRVIAAEDMAPPDGMLDSPTTSFHGTNVAGIIAAVAPNTNIIALDVFAGIGAADADILAAINWSINHKAQYNIVAINLSLGNQNKYPTECNNSYATAAFASAKAAGITPVVANGNNGYSDGLSSPACAPNAIRVGAVYDTAIGSQTYSKIPCTDANTQANKIACWSNNSNLTTLLAPGMNISAADVTMSGTSQAAPHVTASIAILKSYNVAPNDTPDETLARLTTTGMQITDQRNNITKPRIDLYAATNTTKTNTPIMTIQSAYCQGKNTITFTGSGYATRFEVYQSDTSSFTNQNNIYTGTEKTTNIDVPNGSYVRGRSCGGSVCTPYTQASQPIYYKICQ